VVERAILHIRKPMLYQKSFENEHSSLNNSTKWLKLLSHCDICCDNKFGVGFKEYEYIKK